MDIEIFLGFEPILMLFLCIALHVGLRQIKPAGKINLQFLFVFCLVYIVGIFFRYEITPILKDIGFIERDLFGYWIGSSFIYLGFGFCYINILNIPISSIRICALKAILKNNEYGTKKDSLYEQFGAKQVLDIRINRLLDSGQILYSDGKYSLGKKRQILLSFFCVILRRIVLGKVSKNE